MGEPTPTGDTWRARPALAAGLRLFILLVPIVASLAATSVLRRLLPSPDGPWWFAWALGVLACALLVAVGVERAARRLLPLVTLLKLSMLFPDQAPTRFSVARTAGSVRRLEARLAETQDDAASREEARTAETILSLSVALQSHDRRTRGHAERVRVFTDLLGEELQLSEADRYRLRWAALMHDIGKLTIAPRILNKPGALDEHEWRLMKGHPVEGARIAEPIIGWLGPWANAIVEHHERFDGKGYPNGLAGGSISLGGRIVSVADSYDTMTAARSYKKPMAVWAARRELADCAGGQFDPEIVRAFLSISLPRLLWRTGPVSLRRAAPLPRTTPRGRTSIGHGDDAGCGGSDGRRRSDRDGRRRTDGSICPRTQRTRINWRRPRDDERRGRTVSRRDRAATGRVHAGTERSYAEAADPEPRTGRSFRGSSPCA